MTNFSPCALLFFLGLLATAVVLVALILTRPKPPAASGANSGDASYVSGRFNIVWSQPSLAGVPLPVQTTGYISNGQQYQAQIGDVQGGWALVVAGGQANLTYQQNTIYSTGGPTAAGYYTGTSEQVSGEFLVARGVSLIYTATYAGKT